MWSENSTASLFIFSYLSANETTPVLFSCLENTSSLQAPVFQGKRSYREEKILFSVPDVWGCSKYSCSISMGIKAVMISVTCCGQPPPPPLCPSSHWQRNLSDLFICCFLIPWASDCLIWPNLFWACVGKGCQNKQGVSLSPIPSPVPLLVEVLRFSRRKPTGQLFSQMLSPEQWN